MWRVLKITVGLMGVLQLVLVGGRIGGDNPDAMVVTAYSSPNTAALYLVYVHKNSTFQQAIAPAIGKSPTIVRSDEQGCFVLVGPDAARTLYRVWWDGRDPVAVAAKRTFAHPTQLWVLDSGWILFTDPTADNRTAIFRVRLDGTGFEQLTPPAFIVSTEITLAPDQSWLAFRGANDADGTSGFYMMRPNGDDLTRVALPALTEPARLLVWASDRPYLFATILSRNRDLITIGRIRFHDQAVTAPQWEAFDIAETPRTAFSIAAILEKPNLVIVALGSPPYGGLLAFDLDSLQMRWTVPYTYYLSHSPDERWIFVAHYTTATLVPAGSHAQLERIRSDGSDVEPLSLESVSLERVSYSPDGQRVAFVTDRLGSAEAYWWMPAQGGRPKFVAHLRDHSHYVTWSPDGEWLYFQEYEQEKGRGEMFGVRLRDRHQQTLHSTGQPVIFQTWAQPSRDWQSGFWAGVVAVTLIFVPLLISRIRRQAQGKF